MINSFSINISSFKPADASCFCCTARCPWCCQPHWTVCSMESGLGCSITSSSSMSSEVGAPSMAPILGTGILHRATQSLWLCTWYHFYWAYGAPKIKFLFWLSSGPSLYTGTCTCLLLEQNLPILVYFVALL